MNGTQYCQNSLFLSLSVQFNLLCWHKMCIINIAKHFYNRCFLCLSPLLFHCVRIFLAKLGSSLISRYYSSSHTFIHTLTLRQTHTESLEDAYNKSRIGPSNQSQWIYETTSATANDRVQIIMDAFCYNADEVNLDMESDAKDVFPSNICKYYKLKCCKESEVCFYQQGWSKSSLSYRKHIKKKNRESLSRSVSILQCQLVSAIYPANGRTNMMKRCNLHETDSDITFLKGCGGCFMGVFECSKPSKVIFLQQMINKWISITVYCRISLSRKTPILVSCFDNW